MSILLFALNTGLLKNLLSRGSIVGFVPTAGEVYTFNFVPGLQYDY